MDRKNYRSFVCEVLCIEAIYSSVHFMLYSYTFFTFFTLFTRDNHFFASYARGGMIANIFYACGCPQPQGSTPAPCRYRSIQTFHSLNKLQFQYRLVVIITLKNVVSVLNYRSTTTRPCGYRAFTTTLRDNLAPIILLHLRDEPSSVN